MANTVGLYQPFRYRGYVYDTETQLYYLQSRYYDTSTCRFISADVYLSTGQGVIGHNAFAYCLNDPVCLRDQSGSLPERNDNIVDDGGGSGCHSPLSRYKCIVISLGEFQYDSSRICWKLGLSADEIHTIIVNNRTDFLKAWSEIPSTNEDLIVIINTHGLPKQLCDKHRNTLIDADEVSGLQKKKLKSLIILSCNCGHADHASENIANAFAGIVNCPVYAADGSVGCLTFLSYGDDEFKNHLKGPARPSYGWLVYMGGDGYYYQYGHRGLDWRMFRE